jgi:hypothetical protein
MLLCWIHVTDWSTDSPGKGGQCSQLVRKAQNSTQRHIKKKIGRITFVSTFVIRISSERCRLHSTVTSIAQLQCTVLAVTTDETFRVQTSKPCSVEWPRRESEECQRQQRNVPQGWLHTTKNAASAWLAPAEQTVAFDQIISCLLQKIHWQRQFRNAVIQFRFQDTLESTALH